ncbi:MAG: hypothetical protein EBV86_14675 [Marivivens sp.]|nr:hypothetical protein [Marivivens sp.]NCW69772.1 hypothetical protein [Marivivens sp.]
MPVKGIVWKHQVIAGMTPKYSFDPEKWYLSDSPPRAFKGAGKNDIDEELCECCKWPGTDLYLRSQYKDKNGYRVNHLACKLYGENWLYEFVDFSSLGIQPNYYLGLLCPKGHDWNGTGLSLRRKGVCLECERLRRERKRKHYRQLGREWYRRNAEKHKACTLKNKERRMRENPELELMKTRISVKRNKAKRKAVHHNKTCGKREIRLHFEQVFEKNKCCYCGKEGPVEVDHFYPIDKGGPHVLGNFVPACHECNSNKRAHDPKEWFFRRFGKTPEAKRRWRSIVSKLNVQSVGEGFQSSLF